MDAGEADKEALCTKKPAKSGRAPGIPAVCKLETFLLKKGGKQIKPKPTAVTPAPGSQGLGGGSSLPY